MPRQPYQSVYAISEAQLGYFATWQAEAEGVQTDTVADMKRRGVIERISRGVYRLVQYPLSPFGQYMEASLWPGAKGPDRRGVISHMSALALYELSDVSPAKIHITVPRGTRIRRVVPAHLVVHESDVSPQEVQYVSDVPVTSPARTIRDCHAADLGPALIRQAIDDGRRTGHLTFAEADRLAAELLADAEDATADANDRIPAS